jgi:hypothetical protein
VILEGLEEEGRYKTAARGGRQTRAERVSEEFYNELALLRASYHTVNTKDGEGFYEPILLRDPVDERELERQKAADAAEQAKVIADFESAIGFLG